VKVLPADASNGELHSGALGADLDDDLLGDRDPRAWRRPAAHPVGHPMRGPSGGGTAASDSSTSSSPSSSWISETVELKTTDRETTWLVFARSRLYGPPAAPRSRSARLGLRVAMALFSSMLAML
jgi:hypothetical protein